MVTKFATNTSVAIWWPDLQLIQVALSGGQICDECMWCHVVAKSIPSYGINLWVRCASGNVYMLKVTSFMCANVFQVKCIDLLVNNAGINTNLGWRKCMEVGFQTKNHSIS